MKEKKILVLGYFGYLTNQLDGQTIKTRNSYELLKLKEKEVGTIEHFDTQIFQKSKLNLFKMFIAVWKCDSLVYLPAHNNLKYLFPLIFLFTKIKKIDILYLVVGGWLDVFLENKWIHVTLLKRIKSIFTETQSLRLSLENKYDFQNVSWFPNFRIHSFSPQLKNPTIPLKLVFMARINKMKGLKSIFTLAEYCRNSFSNYAVTIDFYGPIEKDDMGYFLSNIEKHTNTQYKGELQPMDIYKTLTDYDLLLLPTKYYTEGFPGSILDAYIAGIPVIVTRWKHAEEFVDDGRTGFIVPFENGENDLIEKVKELHDNTEQITLMKQKAYIKSKFFSAESAWNIIKPYLVSTK